MKSLLFMSALAGILFPFAAHYSYRMAKRDVVDTESLNDVNFLHSSGHQMKPVFQIMPLALIFAGAVVGVWRGFGTKPDNTSNRAKGGGAKWKIWK